MVKVGPNRLVAIGNDGEYRLHRGTKVWPIEVERVSVSPARTKLTGCVLDQEGRPIVGAQVELGPNRYTADSWEEGTDFDIYGEVYDGGRKLVGPPVLGYRSIVKDKGYPTVTVEADGYAPQWRHINLGPDPQARSQEFRLKAGRSVRGRVVDEAGKPVGGACVVLDRRHIHTDPDGFFHWAIDAPVPDEVTV